MLTRRFLRTLSAAALVSFLSACSGSGGGSPSSVPAVSKTGGVSSTSSVLTLTPDITAQGQWLAQNQLADGAILYSSNEIEPYFANIAAAGWLKIPSQLPNVRAWMDWYVAHINTTDIWNLGGTVYDYRYNGSVETPMRSADSVDSYNATFLTLARELYDTRDLTSQAYVVSLQPTLEKLAATIRTIQQPDGMTIAMPSYPIAYLEDNCEVHRGLTDLAYLEQTAFLNSTNADEYTTAATAVADGIGTLWNSSLQKYAYAKGEPGGALSSSKWSIWYPDATSQLFPILEGLIPANSSRAVALWQSFNTSFPTWDKLTGMGSSSGGFPWTLVGNTAAMMGDTERSSVYIQTIQSTYGAKGFAWPWYDAESSWYIRMNNQLLLGSSLSPADN